MTDSHTGDIREGLETAMTAARMEMLRLFVEELMIVLAKQDFRLNDLLEAQRNHDANRPRRQSKPIHQNHHQALESSGGEIG